MITKLFSKSTAKKLLAGGVIGLITGVILQFVILIPLYSKVGNCSAGGSACSDSLTWEYVAAKLVVGLMYLSVVAIVAGVLMLVVASARNKHLIIRVVGVLAAFFIGGSIASIIVADVIPLLSPAEDTRQQGYMFAQNIIILYPVAGGLAAYFTSKWLKKKVAIVNNKNRWLMRAHLFFVLYARLPQVLTKA